jgi:hypothetical protein
MARRWLLLLLVVPPLSGCQKEQVAAVAVTAAAAVAAAAINRAATDDCWASCSHGYVCDHDSGRCVPDDELQNASGPAATDRYDDGCIEEADGTVVCPDDPEPQATAGHEGDPDPCRGLCVDGETCVVETKDDGQTVADCKPATTPP